MIKKHKIALFVLTAATISLLSPKPAQAQLNYKASWIGNSFGKNDTDKWVQNNMVALWVAPDGRCYTASSWDEAKREGGIYKDGDVIGGLANLHPNEGGEWGMGVSALTGAGESVYVGILGNVRRYKLDGGHSPFEGGVGNWKDEVRATEGAGYVWALSADAKNDRLYVAFRGYEAQPARDNKPATEKVPDEIVVLSLKEMKPLARWKLERAGRLAGATDGTVWITQEADIKNGIAAKIMHFGADGAKLAGEIGGGAGFSPAALHFDAAGRLMVADNGPDQQIKIYDVAGTPKQSGSFGQKGGVFSGVAGEIKPLKFVGLTGVGTDAAGNIYVSQNRFGPNVNGGQGAGSNLESYAPDGKRKWQVLGLEFVDNADATPGTDGTEIYTKYSRYSVDYSKTNLGGEATYQAHTLNPFKYPDDNRYLSRDESFDFIVGSVVRIIGGKKFQFNGTMWGNRLEVYRFDAATDGEIAIPCGQIEAQRIWRDLNGNGRKEATEWADAPTPSGNGVLSYWVDTKGDLWQAYGNGDKAPAGLRRFISQGLDANGSPIWNVANTENTVCPSSVGEAWRVEYLAETDTMYLSGYSDIDPTHHWQGPYFNEKGIGSVVARYDNWKTGNRTARWVQVLDDYNRTPTSMAVAGDFIFIGWDGGPYQPDSGHVKVYRASDGVNIGRMWAGPFGTGRMDVENGVRALKRANGEYVIFTEDDWYARVMMYRWTPPTAVPAAVKVTATAGNLYTKLSWSANPNASLYRVKRATSATGPFATIATQQATSLTDLNKGAGLINGTTYYYQVQGVAPAGDGPDSAAVSTAPLGSYALRIDSGSWEGSGNWIGDNFVSGGDTNGGVGGFETKGIADAAPANIYETARRIGKITYTFPNQIPGAVYTVRLHFGEYWFNPGDRKLNVLVNSTQVVTDLDVNALAGGKAKAYVKELTGIKPNAANQVIVTIDSGVEPMISGIELIPTG